MSREWKPGDVAMVNDTTRPEAPWKVAMCVPSKVPGVAETRWRIDSGEVWGSVSDARPLVVIDPEDRGAVERLVTLFSEQAQWYSDAKMQRASAMQAALREYATPKPPKPEEPQGLGAVVEDEDGVPWVRCENVEREPHWYARNKKRDWPNVAAVRVLSPGVEVDK